MDYPVVTHCTQFIPKMSLKSQSIEVFEYVSLYCHSSYIRKSQAKLKMLLKAFVPILWIGISKLGLISKYCPHINNIRSKKHRNIKNI
jgi:hypothetical protein